MDLRQQAAVQAAAELLEAAAGSVAAGDYVTAIDEVLDARHLLTTLIDAPSE